MRRGSRIVGHASSVGLWSHSIHAATHWGCLARPGPLPGQGWLHHCRFTRPPFRAATHRHRHWLARLVPSALSNTASALQDNDWGVSKFPFIPGHEVVGVVAAVGASVKGLAAGDRVGVGWIANSCRTCAACLRGDENLCEKGYTGLITMGACPGGVCAL